MHKAQVQRTLPAACPMMAPGNDGSPGESGNPGRQEPAGSKKDASQSSNPAGLMRAPARRVRRRSDPAPGGFVMHWKLDKVKEKFRTFYLSPEFWVRSSFPKSFSFLYFHTTFYEQISPPMRSLHFLCRTTDANAPLILKTNRAFRLLLQKDKKRGVIVPVIVNSSGQLVSSPHTFTFNATPSQQQQQPPTQQQQTAQFVISNNSPPSSTGKFP